MIQNNSVQRFCQDLEGVLGPFQLTVGSEGGAYSAQVLAHKGEDSEVTGTCTAANAYQAMMTAVRDAEFKLAQGTAGVPAQTVAVTTGEKLAAVSEKLANVADELANLADEF